MILRKTVRYYKVFKKTWIKEGSHDKETHVETIKRTTFWVLFIPILWYEVIINTNI